MTHRTRTQAAELCSAMASATYDYENDTARDYWSGLAWTIALNTACGVVDDWYTSGCDWGAMGASDAWAEAECRLRQPGRRGEGK